jgi:hypothetical protein
VTARPGTSADPGAGADQRGGVVQLAAAPVIQVEVLVGVGPASHGAEPNDVVLAHDLGQPIRGVDHGAKQYLDDEGQSCKDLDKQ